MKQCGVCKENKDFSQFYPHRKGKNGLSHRCKRCDLDANRKYRKSHPEKVQQWHKTVRPEKYKAYHIKSRYGLSIDQYQQMLESQYGLCAICRKPETVGSGALSIDHCHDSGSVRGLLCRKCNTAIGQLSNQTLLQNAIDYLERTNPEQVGQPPKPVDPVIEQESELDDGA